jgi:Flp pilus assembly protein TadD
LLYRLGALLRHRGDFDSARTVYLQLCSCAPCCAAWLGVATCSLALNDTPTAESSLIQANRLDRSDPSVWARLAWVSLRANRLPLAHQALMHALQLGCTEQTLLAQIGGLYAEKGFLTLAASTLERALALHDSAPLRVQLAGVLQAQQRLEHADAHLQHASRIATDEQQQAQVRSAWEAVQKALGRTLQTFDEEQPVDGDGAS